MKKIFAVLLAMLMLVMAGCGKEPPPETTDGTEPPATESTSEPDAPVDEPKGLRTLVLDNNKDGINDYKIVVDTEAAKSTEKVPFRIPDLDNPSEDSFRTVSLYKLTAEGETLVWYSNLCMGSSPRGGVALKNGAVFSYYYDIYEYGEGRRISISCYEYYSDLYGNGNYPYLKMKTGSYVTAEIPDEIWEDNFAERHSYELRNAVNTLDEMLDGAEILLDVTGTEPIWSTDENRFTKQYAFKFDYRDLEGCLAEEKQDSYIIPAK